MSCFGKRIDGRGSRRRQARKQVSLVGRGVSLEGSTSVLVEDLSSTGIRVLGRRLPPPGQEMVVQTVDRGPLFGRVTWAKHDRRGILLSRE
jgi:hypothetical protein